MKTEKLSLSSTNYGENYYARGRLTNKFSSNNDIGINMSRSNSKSRQRSTSRRPILKENCHHCGKYSHYKKKNTIG